MASARAAARRLLLEQLSERIAFYAGEMHDEEATLLYTPTGQAYYYDAPPNLAVLANELSELELGMAHSGVGPKVGPIQPPIAPALLTVPVYHSNPSFPKKIYLDFDGHVAENTFWNNNNFGGYLTGSTINAPAFSLDTDLASFNSNELALIQDVWARVAEDYAPFQVDVTTEEPPAELFTQGGQAIRAVITTTTDAVTGQEWFPAAGGVAFMDSWNFTNGSPCWVFTNYLAGYSKYVAEATTHEVGHTLNLNHDGRTSPAEGYYLGHGSGATSWGAIMGAAYYINVSQWSQGEYTAADNFEDDLAIIASKLPYINDDHGDTTAAATQLNVGTAGSLATSGLITTRTDVDAFRFPTQAGTITLRVDPFDYATNKANLDAKITLLDSTGQTVAVADNPNALNSIVTVNVPKGFYTILVDGVGRPAISGDEGYSDYGSIGRYSVSGTIMANAAPIVTNDTAQLAANSSALIDVLGNDSDPNNDVLTILSMSTPAVGSAVVESGKIRYTAGTTAGPVTFVYTVQDELGATSTGNVTVTVTSNLPPSDITLSSAVVTENSAGANIGALVVTDPNAGDVHTLTVDDSRFEIVAGMLKLKAGVRLNYEATPTVNLNITANDLANAQFTKSFTISVVDLPEFATSAVALGDNTVQRSWLNNVSVTFDGAVTLASGALTVTKRGADGGVVTSAASSTVNAQGQTVVTLNFSGPFTRNSSGALVDGFYQLTIDGTKISRGGQLLDSNGDGQTGDVSTIGSSEADKFFALYGDTDGDGIVGVAEFGQFRSTFGKSAGQPGYNALFDYDGDAIVGVSDFGQFRSRFGKPKAPFV